MAAASRDGQPIARLLSERDTGLEQTLLEVESILSPLSTAMVDHSAPAGGVTLSAGGLPWPQPGEGARKEWAKRWKDLARADILLVNERHPSEPEGANFSQRMDLWRRSIKGDDAAMDGLRDAETASFCENFADSGLTPILIPVFGLPIVVSASMIEKYIGSTGSMTVAVVLGLMSIAVVIRMHVKAYRRGKWRERVTSQRQWLIAADAAGRLRSHVEAACRLGAAVSPELVAISELLADRGAGAMGNVSVDDCLALSTLSDSTGEAVKRLRQGSTLSVGGESSELLHRVAGAMGLGDLEERTLDVASPPKIVI